MPSRAAADGMDRKAEEEPIAELWVTTTTQRGAPFGGRAAGWRSARYAPVHGRGSLPDDPRGSDRRGAPGSGRHLGTDRRRLDDVRRRRRPGRGDGGSVAGGRGWARRPRPGHRADDRALPVVLAGARLG